MLFINLSVVLIIGAALSGGSVPFVQNHIDKIRTYTRAIEFDYPTWIANALFFKLKQASLGSERFISTETEHQMVVDYLQTIHEAQVLEWKINIIYADPDEQDPQAASAEQRKQLDGLKAKIREYKPVAEAILQDQVTTVIRDLGLTFIGQPVPPVLYSTTPLPTALIVSPRNVIRQDADISLLPDLSVEQRTKLEQRVDQGLDVSSLVVDIGGIGVYPTMIQETSSLGWLSEVVAHEWIHNFLTLRPLGMNYMTSPELRIMNETAASIAGKEIGQQVLERYYPELLPPPQPETPPSESPTETSPEPAPPVFDFRKEMHTTRVTADQLLAEGKIEEAEKYMEERRHLFWDNGYLIRKLNQAYFAFHGAYADQPGGAAAGKDPIGAAVRALRAQSSSLSEFIKQISWMSSFEQLQRSVQ
jgi:hypothetical protein